MDRFKSVGEYVEDTAIMRVAQLNPLFVETIIPVTHMGKIKPGMQAKVTPAVPGQKARYAVVTRIDRVADAASGTFGVRLELDNPNGDLVSGVRCALEFDSSRPIVSLGPDKRPKVSKQPALAVSKAPIIKHTSSTTKEPIVEQVAMTPIPNSTQSAHCFEAGPINSQLAADELVSKLNNGDQDASVREMPGEHAGQYFVLTRATHNHADALTLIADLKSRGITDTHLLRKGESANSISLGLFTSRKSADQRAADLSALGIDAHVAPRTPATLWLNISSVQETNANAIRSLLAPGTPERVRNIPCDSLQASIK